MSGETVVEVEVEVEVGSMDRKQDRRSFRTL